MPKKKRPVRQCKLTPEGWVYIVIVCFIATGAVLRNVNLLIVATGMLVTPIIFNWRVCVANLRSLTAHRITPDRVHAGESINVLWSCENKDGRITARNLMLHDRLKNESRETSKTRWQKFKRYLLELAEQLSQRTNLTGRFAQVNFHGVTPSDRGVASYQCFFPSRGEYEIGPAQLRTSFPFGLVACNIPLDNIETIFVAPSLGKLNPTWEQRIDSAEVGSQSRLRRRGLEQDEFFALRQWRSGDSMKHVHWRSTARIGYPMVKQFDQPNDRDFGILVDMHAADEPTRLQCEIALSFAATAIAELAAEIHGKLGIAICGAETRLVVGQHNPETRRNAMRRLATADTCADPDVESAVSELASRVSLGTPLYCLSTRPEPSWLTEEASDDQKQQTRSAIRQMVRWIQVGTDRFDELFAIDDAAANATARPAVTKPSYNSTATETPVAEKKANETESLIA